jgi:hypothetical protein
MIIPAKARGVVERDAQSGRRGRAAARRKRQRRHGKYVGRISARSAARSRRRRLQRWYRSAAEPRSAAARPCGVRRRSKRWRRFELRLYWRTNSQARPSSTEMRKTLSFASLSIWNSTKPAGYGPRFSAIVSTRLELGRGDLHRGGGSAHLCGSPTSPRSRR